MRRTLQPTNDRSWKSIQIALFLSLSLSLYLLERLTKCSVVECALKNGATPSRGSSAVLLTRYGVPRAGSASIEEGFFVCLFFFLIRDGRARSAKRRGGHLRLVGDAWPHPAAALSCGAKKTAQSATVCILRIPQKLTVR